VDANILVVRAARDPQDVVTRERQMDAEGESAIRSRDSDQAVEFMQH
jgi:hypothetical protein